MDSLGSGLNTIADNEEFKDNMALVRKKYGLNKVTKEK